MIKTKSIHKEKKNFDQRKICDWILFHANRFGFVFIFHPLMEFFKRERERATNNNVCESNV